MPKRRGDPMAAGWGGAGRWRWRGRAEEERDDAEEGAKSVKSRDQAEMYRQMARGRCLQRHTSEEKRPGKRGGERQRRTDEGGVRGGGSQRERKRARVGKKEERGKEGKRSRVGRKEEKGRERE